MLQNIRISKVVFVALTAAAAGAPSAYAQETADHNRPTANISRIDPAQAPTIDGDLTDAGWAHATVIEDFVQIEPVPGNAPSERTVVRIMYDEENFYLSVYAFDSSPEEIVIRSMARDGPLYTGDVVGFWLDPGPTRRNAYYFQVGPSGGRNDSLTLNNNAELEEWDPIWAASAMRVPDGWVAEVAIPFQSLSFDEASDWGFEFSRQIRRKNEEVKWSTRNPAIDFTDVSQAGTITGINNIHRGLGLDVQVYGVVQAKRDWHIPGEDTGISGTAGGNGFYKITPALTGTLTFNPDFSDAPLDARQVNTSRFSLFYPETRDFFLQDAAAFEFGGRGFARGDEDDRDANNGRPFFSRNIGLVDGEQVSIIGGGKLSGEFAGFGIGALSVLTDDTPFSEGQVLSVARVTRPVLAESKLGVIVTNGDPTGLSDNTVAGADFQYRNSNLFGDNIFQADTFYERSFSSVLGDDDSFGLALNYPNEPWSWDVSYKEIGARFEPALGFANRTGIRAYEADGASRHRVEDSWIREWELSTANVLVTDLRNRQETRESALSLEVEMSNDNEFGFQVTNIFEDVRDPFDLPNNIIVPMGEYNWTNVSAEFETSNGRPFAVSAEVECCSFYNGDGFATEVEASYRPNAYFEIEGGWEMEMLDMPNGSVDIHVFSASSTVNFTPDMAVALQAQWDSISKDLGFLARYRWEFMPGSELFVALGQAGLLSRHGVTAQRSQLSIRLGHTFRL